MVHRFKVAWLTAVLGVALMAGSATPALAAKPPARIPTSAADWATFTPAEKDAMKRILASCPGQQAIVAEAQ